MLTFLKRSLTRGIVQGRCLDYVIHQIPTTRFSSRYYPLLFNKIVQFIFIFKLLKQDSWNRGHPVVVSRVTQSMDMAKWTPQSFFKEFKKNKTDLVNCMTGDIIPNQSLKKFWEGFEDETKRLLDKDGKPMILKLKVISRL